MRIEGITIPEHKRLEIGLTALFGVGRSRAHEILQTAGVSPGARPSELTQTQETAIRNALEQYTLEGELKREEASHIKRLKDIRSYRGSRHAKHLPARGQRTQTNSRTVRGNVRKTMGSGKRKVEKK